MATFNILKNQSERLYAFKLCTNKNHSYKHNEQINKQNIDNSECFGVNKVKHLSRNDYIGMTNYMRIPLK